MKSKKRWYLFLLQGSWRTRDIEAYTLKQAWNIAKKEYGERLIDTYQVASQNAFIFSGWKDCSYLK
jgi:hypothetical protein